MESAVRALADTIPLISTDAPPLPTTAPTRPHTPLEPCRPTHAPPLRTRLPRPRTPPAPVTNGPAALDAPPAPHMPPTDLFHVKPGQAANPHPGRPPKTTQSFRPRPARTPGTRPRGPSPHPGQQQLPGHRLGQRRRPTPHPGQQARPRRGHRKRAGTVRLPRPGQLGGQGAPQARKDYPAAARRTHGRGLGLPHRREPSGSHHPRRRHPTATS